MMNTKKIQAKLKEAGLDAIVIFSEENIRYAGSFPFTDGAVVVTREKSWLLTDSRIRLKELDMDTYRAVVSMSIYTLLLDGGCEQAFQGRPVSLDFVAAEVCRCSLSVQYQISYESRAELDWSVVKIFLAMGVLAGGCSAVILSGGSHSTPPPPDTVLSSVS